MAIEIIYFLKSKTNFPSSNSRLGSGSRKQYPIQKKSYQQRYQQNNDNKTILDTIVRNCFLVFIQK